MSDLRQFPRVPASVEVLASAVNGIKNRVTQDGGLSRPMFFGMLQHSSVTIVTVKKKRFATCRCNLSLLLKAFADI